MTKSRSIPIHLLADPNRWRQAWNFVGFQLGWFACVLGAAHDVAWLGPAVVAVLLAVHLRLSTDAGGEVRVAAAAALVGIVLDSALATSGRLTYAGSPGGFISPPWIVGMWVNFALTLKTSLAWLKGRDIAAALLGAISGPLSYVAGGRLGAIEFAEPAWIALLLLALAWGIVLPALLRFAHREVRPC